MSYTHSDFGSLFEGRAGAAVELAKLAGDSTLELFCQPRLEVIRKGDDSPVTAADRGAEKLIRERLSALFPDDAVLGEEFGESEGSSGYQWIIDPIDGTKSFICGVPLYSTLVGLVRDRRCVVGAIYIPALSEMVFAADGAGCWHGRLAKQASTPQDSAAPSSGAGQGTGGTVWENGGPSRCQVSKRPLTEGLFVSSQADSFAKQGAGDGYEALQKTAYITRTWGDGYGYLLVATGRAELMVDPIANAWDLAPAQPIIQEAGGRFTSWSGEETVFGGNAIASNGLGHETAISRLTHR